MPAKVIRTKVRVYESRQIDSSVDGFRTVRSLVSNAEYAVVVDSETRARIVCQARGKWVACRVGNGNGFGMAISPMNLHAFGDVKAWALTKFGGGLMKKTKLDSQIEAVITAIEKRLDSLEELMFFSIKASLRFKKRQRVKLSAIADRQNVMLLRGARKGTVVEVGSYIVTVLPDGYKKPHDYWHGYWEPVARAK